MNDSKEEEALCNNVQNHRQQLLNHQQEIDRDLEAGSCNDDDDDESREEGEGEEGEEGKEGEEGEHKEKQEIPAIYNVEPGCTALGCYSAIITFIIMTLGIIALLIHSSPPNARADNYNATDGFNLSAIKPPPPPPPPPLTTLAPDLIE
ncbi:uncharacterized protein [Macrobrachium rosenbergii]